MPRRTVFAIAATAVLLGLLPASAGIVDTPQCRTRLARASSLVDAIAARENSVRKGDTAGLCRLLRANLKDMQEARDGMAQCLTGHERGENVAQMDVSMGDIRHVLARNCR